MSRYAQVPTEKALTERILKELRKIPGVVAEKRHGGAFGKAGEPDITGCYKGWRFELEVKRPGVGRLTPLQKAALQKWASAGAYTAIVRSVEDALAVIEEIRERTEEMERLAERAMRAGL